MIKSALAQINPAVGDFDGNEKKIVSYIEEAEKNSADVIIFPELCLTGYPPEDLLLRPAFIKAAESSLERIAKSAKRADVILGAPIVSDGKLYNAAVICRDGKVQETVFKSHLPNYGVFDEKRYFTAGISNHPVLIAGKKTAVTICEDIWVEGGPPAEACSDPETELIINISSSPFHIGKSEERRGIATSFAKKFKKPMLYCNLIGGQDELIFDGGSFVCDRNGIITGSAGEFHEELFIAEIPMQDSNLANGADSCKMEYPENVFEALKLGVSDYVCKNGFRNVLVAISGGIDSAITAHIAVSALGPDKVKGVALPSPYSSESSLEDARQLAKNLGIHLDIIPISNLMDAFGESLADAFKGTSSGLAEENIQARIRGTIMMALSNKFGSLLLTTGNKSELGVGYCTLYGDMAGGFSAIKDLPKMKVYELARWINGQGSLPAIPESTISKEPSAELRPDQKDSDSLPPYEELDPILKLYVEDEKSIEEIISLGYIETDVRKVARLVDLNEYKRRQAAPGVRITPKAFGKDRRMPITNMFNMKRHTGETE